MPTTSNSVEYIKIVGFGKTDSASISTITVSGSVATATFAAPHGYQIGDYFEVSGVSGGVAAEDALHNSVFMVTGVPTSSSVTYAISSSATASAGGTKVGRRMRGGAAATCAESIAAAEARLKPTLDTALIHNIAHFIPVSRQAIDDIPQLQMLCDGELIYGTELELERSVLYGAGGGSEIQGICSHSQIQTFTGADPDTKLDVIRRAVTKSMMSNYPPTAGVVHPTDFEQIELTKGNDGHYVWVQVPTGGGNVLWRLPIVVTASMLEGDALVGNFQMAATLHDRQEPEIRFSEHHASFFTSGMLAMLCELRAGLSIARPESFVSIDFGTATH
jgi:HK97 family phage major capsid protein